MGIYIYISWIYDISHINICIHIIYISHINMYIYSIYIYNLYIYKYIICILLYIIPLGSLRSHDPRSSGWNTIRRGKPWTNPSAARRIFTEARPLSLYHLTTDPFDCNICIHLYLSILLTESIWEYLGYGYGSKLGTSIIGWLILN